jgi:hypothetical protein
MNFTRTETGKKVEAAALVSAHESEFCKTSLEVVGLLVALRTRYRDTQVRREINRKPSRGALSPVCSRRKFFSYPRESVSIRGQK